MKYPSGICVIVLTSELCSLSNFVLGFQDAMGLALQSVLELQVISCTKEEEEGDHAEAPSNAPNPCDDFVSYLSS